MGERKTGVSGSVGGSSNSNNESVTITLTVSTTDEPDTIYNLLFKEYDEEKNE